MAEDTTTPQVEEKPEEEIKMTVAQFNELMNRLNAVEKVANPTPVQQQQPFVNSVGQLQGKIEHGDINKDNYEDPTDKLSKEKKLAKYVVDNDYRFEFEVIIRKWPGKYDNLQHLAPRFRLYIWRTVRDDDNDDEILGYALVQKGEFKTYDYNKFYEWVGTVFRPQKVKPSKQTTERNIGGKIVEFREHEEIESVTQTMS